MRSSSRRTVGLITALSVVCGAGVNGQAPDRGTSAQGFQLVETTINEIHAALKSGKLSCRSLVELYLERIEANRKSESPLNAIQTINPRALEEADQLDAAYRASGALGTLHCVPVLVKDQFETRGLRTTYGSAVFGDFVPQRDATVITRLKKAGALILAKNTMGEYAGNYVDGVAGGVRNPYDQTRHAGGSSSGTGAGIAANFGAVGIGEDTGGSIRGPATFNGLVGLRPTTQLVSRYGMMPATPSRDSVGPITRTVGDAALVLDVIAGYDPDDPVTAYAVGKVPASYAAFLSKDGLKGVRIGIIRESMGNTTDEASEDYKIVRAVFDRGIADLRRLGAELIDPLPPPKRDDDGGGGGGGETEEAIDAYLAQHPNAPVKSLAEILLSGKVVPRRARGLMRSIGRSTSELGYLQGLRAREDRRVAWLKLMADHDVAAVVYATSEHQPTLIPPGIMTDPDVKDEFGKGSNRGVAPSIGFPAIAVPAGFTTENLPVGIEFMGRPFDEGTLLRLAYAYEQGTHHRRPPVTMPSGSTAK